ncbi:glycosyltransferase family 1 protein [Epilithonimonas lactis]|uniref:Glycosyl transferase n=1 Tax=Epilithonimonas lactis TaxID=421072 RepID=A0A085B6K3_9FLAO|nr:glycosyltransferase family 1 protein [Epilithonimonas lactis]KFC18098.1 glycosyl transferase [Epilithonimonas lactis]SER12056.1 Glycosyltransferase involved in cell wall bisynthesis [Epilithonimonas lactis]
MQNILCFSHLHWDFVYQRPQHLLTRFAQLNNVYYFEEPRGAVSDFYEIDLQNGVSIIKIFIYDDQDNRNQRLEKLINKILEDQNIKTYSCWYYTPMALEYTSHLKPEVTIYDSMDELSAFRFAPPQLLELENELFKKADVVFTGGHTLYQAKKNRHHNIHPFPSSIDKYHFKAARYNTSDAEDQKHIPNPRFGFYGVIDERFDIELLREVSAKRPDWHFVIIGPVVKIDVNELPRAENIHYLGSKKYAELPNYISHWDIAMVMFAINESTEFISPTKTPEYLAAGLPVISTPIKDVVKPYGEANLVYIADSAETFIAYAEEEFNKDSKKEWLAKVDEYLADESWDNTFEKMNLLITNAKKTSKIHV